ncbi:MAG TPA: hypothetical protein GXZ77_06650 [Papillibacter sp.]|jgi:hypothetical protein|nr:hypothetical protein [Papillibacter sp.]
MNKVLRIVILIASMLIAIATAAMAIVYFKDEILDLLDSIKEKTCKKAQLPDEYIHYADV